MSSKLHDTQGQEVWQEVDKSDEDWNELVASRLPADLERKAIELKAWSRQREVRSILDLLRALLVLLTCAEKTKVNSQHGHNTGKEWLFDVSTALWHAATPLRCVAGEDNKHSSVRPA